jgi:hypothetical protein
VNGNVVARELMVSEYSVILRLTKQIQANVGSLTSLTHSYGCPWQFGWMARRGTLWQVASCLGYCVLSFSHADFCKGLGGFYSIIARRSLTLAAALWLTPSLGRFSQIGSLRVTSKVPSVDMALGLNGTSSVGGDHLFFPFY